MTRQFPVKIQGDPEGDSEPLNDLQWGELFGAYGSGVVGSPGSSTLEAYRTPSGLFVRPGSARNAGVLFEVTPAEGDVAVTGLTANATGQTRYDLLAIRRNLAVDTKPLLTYVPGGTTPPTPSYNPAGTNDVRLAVCHVPSGSTIPSTVIDARDFLPAGVIPCNIIGDLSGPGAARVRAGTLAYEYSTGLLRLWTGTAWKIIEPGVRTATGFDTQVFFNASGTADITHGLGWTPHFMQFAPRLTDESPSVQVTLSTISTAITATTAKVVAKTPNGNYASKTLARVDWIATRTD